MQQSVTTQHPTFSKCLCSLTLKSNALSLLIWPVIQSLKVVSLICLHSRSTNTTTTLMESSSNHQTPKETYGTDYFFILTQFQLFLSGNVFISDEQCHLLIWLIYIINVFLFYYYLECEAWKLKAASIPG